ncbi:E3 ubiquitin-protein ligase TRIM71-like [Acanthaster planci]|uniref:E3 ubiquitin-protein ligase TRIM71-like n=1 Tax=Acanthaster planci TaxID=133434 RepID=A0A8B7YKM2_ACAPL|nr:E3 ubiquitin-protein ligase TRIM71-like [Acanthaster planci]XP_022093813.1 E3 ubiquitin-protein ligase TRIM71-like [Acanthaster planci]
MEENCSSVLNKIGQHLECPICQGTFKNPKTLNCLHSFCGDCLRVMTRSHPNSKRICCPVCRQDTVLPHEGIDDLRTNFPLLSLVEDLMKEETAPGQGSSDAQAQCESCDQGRAACFQCLDCPMDLCKSCRVVHQRVKVLSTHTTVSHEELKNGRYGPCCQDHDKEWRRFYCTVCEELICKRCFEESCAVRQHAHESIEDVAKAKRAILQKLAGSLQKLATKISSEHTYESKRFLAGKENRSHVAEEIRKEAAKIRERVTAAEERLLGELAKADLCHGERFTKYVKDSGAEIENLHKAVTSAAYVAENSSNGDILSVCSLLIKDLEEMAGQNFVAANVQPEFMQFVPDPPSQIALGRLIRRSTWMWEPFDCFGEQGRLALEFGWARGLAAHSSGGLAVADCESRKLVLLSPLGKVNERLELDEYPNDVSMIGERLIVVDRSRTVKIFSNRKQEFRFQTALPVSTNLDKPVDLQSLARTPAGNVLVGDASQNIVTEHRAADGALLVVTSVPVKPNYIAIDSRNRLVLSDWDQGQVVIVDRGSGETVATINPSTDAGKISCRGLCVDGSGVIFVAVVGSVEDTGHIHTYDGEGNFLGCIVQKLRNPYGIALTPEGRLAVADWDTLKMFNH